MKETGGSTTFRIFGICALILSAIHFAIQYFMDKYKTKSGKEIYLSKENNGALGIDNGTSNGIDNFYEIDLAYDTKL